MRVRWQSFDVVLYHCGLDRALNLPCDFFTRPQVQCRKKYTQRRVRFPHWLSDSTERLLWEDGPSGSHYRHPVLPIKTRTLPYEEKSRNQCPITGKKGADISIPMIVPPYNFPGGWHKKPMGLREEQWNITTKSDSAFNCMCSFKFGSVAEANHYSPGN